MKKISQKPELGKDGFSQRYWQENYSDLDEMDGIANARAHALYLKGLFDLEYIDISTIVDLGAGLGFIAKEMVDVFKPYRFDAIEPSMPAYQKLVEKWKSIVPIQSTQASVSPINITQWCEQVKKNKFVYDVGVCNSVLQYLSKSELEKSIPTLAKHCRYLYLAVPTSLELKRQREEIKFTDHYAFRRPKKFYMQLLRPHFTFVSARLLESKYFFDAKSTFFSDLLYRF